MSELRIVCAWCGTVMAEGGPLVSHGCCQSCLDGLLAKVDAMAANDAAAQREHAALLAESEQHLRDALDAVESLS